MTAAVAPETSAASMPMLPTPSQVTALQAVRDYPCISLLLTTTPSAAMLDADIVRLRHLVREARRRLSQEGIDAAAALARLDDTFDEVVTGPTTSALAVFASAGTASAVRLPVQVSDRVVIDPTFATRDLVRALHRTPRHVVLLLSSTQARLLDAVGDQLRPVVGGPFPLRSDGTRNDGTGRGDGRRGRTADKQEAKRDADLAAFLRTVDRALGTYLRLHPAPLVLVGPAPVLSAFRSLSRNTARLAGAVSGNLAGAPFPELAERIRPVLDAYLHSRQAEALELIEKRYRAHRVVSGMPSAWLAARRERPEMLAVEDCLVYPARLSADGDLLTPAEDVEHPEVIDDAVDEIIELVLDRGGWVALMEAGSLAAHEGIALTVR